MPIDNSTAFYQKVRSDNAYIVSEISEGLASGGKFNLHFENPSDTGVDVFVQNITLTSTGPYKAEVHDGFSSAPSGGSNAEVQSILLDSNKVDNDGIINANTDVTFTSDSTHAVGVAGGGKGGSSIGGSTQHPTLLMEDGREIVVEVTNTDTEAHDYSIQIVYFEVKNGNK